MLALIAGANIACAIGQKKVARNSNFLPPSSSHPSPLFFLQEHLLLVSNFPAVPACLRQGEAGCLDTSPSDEQFVPLGTEKAVPPPPQCGIIAPVMKIEARPIGRPRGALQFNTRERNSKLAALSISCKITRNCRDHKTTPSFLLAPPPSSPQIYTSLFGEREAKAEPSWHIGLYGIIIFTGTH